jgi:2-polyprenyl-3-methyl-5-hydroxy-6-metoxy-1,4-benzoquinol methylase
MKIDPPGDTRILDAWHANAAPWTNAVRGQQIESRRLVTDQAIVDAVLARAPRTLLDIGCGEGWLARRVSDAGIAVTGIDAVPVLVEQARASAAGKFRVMAYEDIAAGALQTRFDALVCNFSLLGDASVDGLFSSFGRLLEADGSVLIQTLHPVVTNGDAPYRDGWREGSWAGVGDGFGKPAPWYFRTLESWFALFAKHRLTLLELHEPLHPQTLKPASVIFVAKSSP